MHILTLARLLTPVLALIQAGTYTQAETAAAVRAIVGILKAVLPDATEQTIATAIGGVDQVVDDVQDAWIAHVRAQGGTDTPGPSGGTGPSAKRKKAR